MRKINFLLIFLLIFTLMVFSDYKNGIYYKTYGNGKNVLAIHGGPGMDSSYFLPYLLPLAKKNRLIIYDQRGCGKSVNNGNTSISRYIEDIEMLRKSLNLKKIILLAHSFGCIIAAKYLIKYSKNVEKIIFVSGYARRHPEQYKYFRIPNEIQKKLIELEQSNITPIEKKIRSKALKFSLYFYRLKYKAQSFLVNFIKGIRFNDNVSNNITNSLEYLNFDVRNELKKIKRIKSFIIVGKHDIITPPFLSEEMHSILKNSTYKIFSQSGHFPFIEENKKFISLINNFINNE